MIVLHVFGPDLISRFTYNIAGIFGTFKAMLHVDSYSSPNPDSIEAVLYVSNEGPHLGQTVMRYVVNAVIMN